MKYAILLLLTAMVVGQSGKLTDLTSSYPSSPSKGMIVWCTQKGRCAYGYPDGFYSCSKGQCVPALYPATYSEGGITSGICKGGEPEQNIPLSKNLVYSYGCGLNDRIVWINKKQCIYKCVSLIPTCRSPHDILLTDGDGKGYCLRVTHPNQEGK